MKRTLLFAIAGLAAFTMVSCSDDSVDIRLCGNSVLDSGEACDGALGITGCSSLDASKNWQAGGVPTCGAKDSANACKVLAGSCVEVGVVVACGDGKREGIEACDGADGLPLTCAEFDSKKTWKAGGAPACGAKDSADACKILIGSCVEEGAVVVCGDDKREGIEACDGADGLPLTCAEFDSTKKWQAGGAPACGAKDSADACKILIGSCVEEGAVVVCGDNKREGIEACDGADGLPLTCAEFDSTKKWQAGGAPACGAKDSADACKILIGSCVEENVVAVCGDGKKQGSEACDGGDGLPVTCAEFDSTKTWQAGGAPACGVQDSAEACQILVGSCVEVGQIVVCGDGKKEGDEVCDYGKTQTMECAKIDPKYVSGDAKCQKACGFIDLSACVVKEFCGDGIVNNGEQCDPKALLKLTCLDFDKTKDWQAGGKPGCNAAGDRLECKLNIGSCVEVGQTVVCGDGKKEGDEVCDYGRTQTMECAKIDPKYVSGDAKCLKECGFIDLSACVVKEFCGDGIVNNGEQCDPKALLKLTCLDFDKTKVWQAGGRPGCNAAGGRLECKLNIGTCVEAGHSVVCGDGKKEGDEVCDYGKVASIACVVLDPDKYSSGNAVCKECQKEDTSGCVAKAICGNNVVEAPEVCDFGGAKSKNCIDISPRYTGGQAYCTSCKDFDVTDCTTGIIRPKLEWCQLMPPTKIEFTNLASKFALNALVHVSGVTDKTSGLDPAGTLKATFIYGVDPKEFLAWKHLDATGDIKTDHPFADNYTAVLTKADIDALGVDVKQAYFSFGFTMTDSKDYLYCKRNVVDDSVENPKLTFITLPADANAQVMGSAKVQSTIIDKILCEFTFDSSTIITIDSVINSNKGKCTIQAVPGLTCEKNGCITTDFAKSWNLQNWLKDLAAALKANHIILKASTAMATEIDLTLKVRRTNAQSPDKIAILYSTDGTNYVAISDLALLTGDTNVGILIDYKVVLPIGVNNQKELFIKMAPYGLGNNPLRFDDIIITKR